MARAIQWNTAGPNLVLLAVIFIALNAPRDTALLACFGLGAMQDLTSGGTMGLYAFCYGIVALMIVAIQQAVYRRHPVTHLMLALVTGVLVALILAFHGWLRPPGPERAPDGRHLPCNPRRCFAPVLHSNLFSNPRPIRPGHLAANESTLRISAQSARITATHSLQRSNWDIKYYSRNSARNPACSK